MDVTGTELNAVAAVAGRLIITPNPVTTEGQTNIPADLRPGESLLSFLQRHVPDLSPDDWVATISDCEVPPELWGRTYPKQGQLIAVRSAPGRAALQLVALAALTYFTMGAGGLAAGTATSSAGLFATGGLIGGGFAAALGTFVAGSLLINKVLAPKMSDVAMATAKTVYSISGQRNSMRQYQPFACLFGEMRVLPDLAGYPYTFFKGDDQYLAMSLLGGINVHSVHGLAVGDTPLSDYKDITTYLHGFGGHPSVDVPLYGNVDSIAGPALEWDSEDPIAYRTGSADAVALQVDIEGQLYDVTKKGMGTNSTTLTIEYRQKDTSAWLPWVAETINSSKADVIRRTFTRDVAKGRYEVRAWVSRPTYADEGDVCTFTWTQLKSMQEDTGKYVGWGRIAFLALATGQINGSLDTIRATFRARPIPVWTANGWITASTREEGLSNPGAIGLQILRGIRDADGVLQFGLGLDDSRIDIEAWKAFMLHCAARGYRFDKWITSAITIGDLLQQVAQAGMGQFTWRDGSRPSVAWAASGQPLSGVVNMANMARGSFQTTYTLADAADGLEAQYISRDTWETTTLRVHMPGKTSSVNPSRITLEGVTDEAHAAEMARFHLAQSLFQSKSIGFGVNLERLAYRRLSILSVSHDMTQWGYGGRLRSAAIVQGKVQLELDEPVPALASRFIGLRIPGEMGFRTFSVAAFAGSTRQLTLVEPWPDDVPLPNPVDGNPAHDTLWTYDIKSTPGLRVRVVSITPQQSRLGADVVVVPESDAMWEYVYTGTYTPAPNESLLQLSRPKASNIKVVEQINLQGDTEWPELLLTWDMEGTCDHCQVWAARDGEQLRLVDGRALNNRSSFRISGAGQWLIEVRPFDASGRLGDLAYTQHGTVAVDLPPALVDYFTVSQIAGGLRRFAFGYNDSARRPGNFLGVQIRCKAGDTALSVADWDTLTPLSDADEVYSATLETTRPDNGLWTFGARTVNTAGVLSSGVIAFTVALVQSVADADQVAQDLREGLDDVVGLLTGGTPLDQLPGTPLPLAQLAAAHETAIAQADQLLTGGLPVPALPQPLAPLAASQQVAQAAMDAQLTAGAEQLLKTVLAYSGLQQRLTDAGVYVDPATGTVRIYAVDANSDHINSLQLLVDAVQGALSLKATTQYVDSKIAQAALGETELALFEGMDARVSVVEIALDSARQQLLLKASTATVQELTGRVSTAEQRLDAQANEILLRVTTADFQAAQNEVGGRLSTAEQSLQALGDTATIGQSVAVASQASRDVADLGEATLRAVLASWAADKSARAEAARATDETRVRIDEGLAAEATRRQELQAAMQSANAQLAADVLEKSTASVGRDDALAQDLQQLTATVNTDRSNAAASQASEASTRATAVTALSQQLQQLTATVNTDRGNAAAAQASEASTRATTDTALSQQLLQLTATVNTDRGNASAAQANEASTRAALGTALGQRIDSLTATVGTNQTAALAAASAATQAGATAVAAEASQRQALSTKMTGLADPSGATLATLASGLLYDERQARSTAVSAVVTTTNAMVARMPAGTGVLATQAALTAVESAAVTADTAQAQQLGTLTATVNSNHSSVQGSLGALSTAQGSQAAQLQQLTATVGSHTSSIALQANALAQLDGKVAATVTLRLDVNGRVAGFVINNNGVQSDFVVMADRFAVALGGTTLVPFVLGMVAGVPTLTLAGNFYADGSIQGRSLVVRSITADHLDVATLSAINANLGEIVAGLIRSADWSNYINLNATGSAVAAQFGGGKVLVRASGDVELDRVNIRRRNVLANGTHYWGLVFRQETDGDGNWTGGWTPPAETSFYIDTGVDSWEAIDSSINQPFGAFVQCLSGTYWGAVNSGSAFTVFCDAGISVAVTHFPVGSGAYASPRLYLRVAVRVADIHANVQQFRPENFAWSLFKL